MICVFVGAFTASPSGGSHSETIYDKVGLSIIVKIRRSVHDVHRGGHGLAVRQGQPTYIVFLAEFALVLQGEGGGQHSRAPDLFVVPFIVVLTLGNIIRGLQASNSTVGFNLTMIIDDFQKSQSSIEKLRSETLKNESDVQRPTELNCHVRWESLAPINVVDLASIAVVYGFFSNEWSTEVNFMNKTPDAEYSATYTEYQNAE
ncbi:hypothetical protein V7S43_011415 [Phytophthora oleae]|uniref:ABC transmembrane type-1 domain-containing protein n=1 Tax=Phytophthora oleae TaxID=2107226 RepID=A0ABD3F9H2_9STRA